MKRFVLMLVLSIAACSQATGQDQSAVPSALRPTMLAQAGGTPEICTEVYQPVCGTNPNGMRTTYSNACFARAAKATNVTPGECSK